MNAAQTNPTAMTLCLSHNAASHNMAAKIAALWWRRSVHYTSIQSHNNAADDRALQWADDRYIGKVGSNPPCPDHSGLCPAGHELHAATAVQHVLETLLALKLPEP